jgi:hypothetical protein
MYIPIGSSITDAQLTTDDKDNAVTGNMAVTLGGLGSTYFRQVYTWNITHNNSVVGCGVGGATDGNGIIMDDWSGDQQRVSPYPHGGLVAFNISYNNGGSGIQLFAGGNYVVANNSVFNNHLDTNNTGTYRGEILGNGNYNVLIINNVTYTRAGSGVLASNTAHLGECSGTAYSGGCTFQRNVGYCVNAGSACASPNYQMLKGAVWSSGKDLTNPNWMNVGNSSVGSVSTPPDGKNFALQSTSPAIGYLLHETYLPSGTRDAGACDRSLVTCP